MVAVLVGVLPSAGCAWGYSGINEPLDPRITRTLVPGKTTAREVVELLGAPTQVVELGQRSAYRFDSESTKLHAFVLIVFNMASVDSRADRVWTFFDEHDVLTHVGATYASHRTQYSLPWSDIHDPEDMADDDADRPGLLPEGAQAEGGP